MNTPGVRPLMQAPSLPRIASHDQPGDPAAGESVRTTLRGPVRQADHRLPDWKAPSRAPALEANQPGRSASSAEAKRPGWVAATETARPAARAAAPAAAAARSAEAPFASRLRQGNVIRLALGDLVIELALRDSLLHGKVLVEAASDKDLIESRLDDLRRDLERKGVEVARFEVIVVEPEPAASEDPPVRRRLLDVRA